MKKVTASSLKATWTKELPRPFLLSALMLFCVSGIICQAVIHKLPARDTDNAVALALIGGVGIAFLWRGMWLFWFSARSRVEFSRTPDALKPERLMAVAIALLCIGALFDPTFGTNDAPSAPDSHRGAGLNAGVWLVSLLALVPLIEMFGSGWGKLSVTTSKGIVTWPSFTATKKERLPKEQQRYITWAPIHEHTSTRGLTVRGGADRYSG